MTLITITDKNLLFSGWWILKSANNESQLYTNTFRFSKLLTLDGSYRTGVAYKSFDPIILIKYSVLIFILFSYRQRHLNFPFLSFFYLTLCYQASCFWACPQLHFWYTLFHWWLKQQFFERFRCPVKGFIESTEIFLHQLSFIFATWILRLKVSNYRKIWKIFWILLNMFWHFNNV